MSADTIDLPAFAAIRAKPPKCYDTAIDFFANHGGLASVRSDALRMTRPSRLQLDMAIEHAVEAKGQDRAAADRAAALVLAGPWERKEGA